MAKPEACSVCGAAMLSVLYYGADDTPLGGHFVCSNCGPRTAVDITPQPGELQRTLLERKAS